MAEGDQRHAFERLLARIEDGLAVPFLGAGMSAGARPSRTAAAPDGYQPNVRWLNRRLVEMLLPELDTCWGRQRLARSVFVDAWLHCPRRRTPAARWTLKQSKNERALLFLVLRYHSAKLGSIDSGRGRAHLVSALDGLADAARNRLDHLAEAAIWHFGVAHVCQQLQLELFAELEPTDAHVYLAYLAREGLIAEVLTTNYDTCIEKAFERTFYPDERRCGHRQLYSVDPAPQRSLEENELHVIRCLDEYRAKGGRRWCREAGRKPRPVLRLFKLNGCAHVYRDESRLATLEEQPIRNEVRGASERRKRAAERIILTERQLQSFRRERWAQELFQDRARCQALVFSGFGSEEPQIRHTALAVMNEWGSKPSTCCWNLPNAPFMAAYEAELSFTQDQLMRGYRDAHQCDQCGSSGCIEPGPQRQPEPQLSAAAPCFNITCAESGNETRNNCFSGSSAWWFEADCSADRLLPADLFWKRTFQASFLRRVKHACDGPGDFSRWVGQHTPASKLALQQFFRWLSRLDVPSSDGHSPTDPSARRPWKIMFDLLEPEGRDAASDCVAPLRLSRWLMAIRGSFERWETAPHPSHPYFPLQEDPLLILGSLFLVHLSSPSPKPEASAPRPGPLGLEVAFTDDDNSSSNTTLHLVSEEWPESNELPDDARLVRQVVVPSLHRLPRESRMATAGRTIRMGRCIRIAGEELLKVERSNRGMLLRAFAEAPIDTHRARLRRTTKHRRGGSYIG